MPNAAPDVITLDMMRESFYSAVLADALDGLGFKHQSPRVSLLPQTGVDLIVGRCRTSLWGELFHDDPHTYDKELEAVDNCQPDDLMIAAAGGSMRSGIWGELLSTAARNSGCVGVIVDGAVRDIAKMTAMGFPVFSRGRCVYDSMNRQRVIDVNVNVEIDGVTFSPGDLVMADVDGVVVCPQAVEKEAVKAAWEKVHAENITRDAIKAGMKAVDAYAKYGVL